MPKSAKPSKSSPTELTVAVPPGGTTTAVIYPAERTSPDGRSAPLPDAALVLGHGAGAGQRSPFMVAFSQALAALGLDVVTFNFLYTEQRRHAPDRAPVLEACYRAVIEAVR